MTNPDIEYFLWEISVADTLEDLQQLDKKLSLLRDQAAIEANEAIPELVPQPCCREAGHSGPCNGWECDNHQKEKSLTSIFYDE